MIQIDPMSDNITVTIESEDEDVPESGFIHLVVDQASRAVGHVDAEINVQIVNAQTIQILNKKYRGKDEPTNVLSFPGDLPDWVNSNFIGDIVLCPFIIRREAEEFGKSVESRWAHMLVHGTLHLLGMTHDDKQQQTEMEITEQQIMNELGYEDPYQVAI